MSTNSTTRRNWKLNPYNGWSNWYTWNASLWLSNDEYLYRSVQDLAIKYRDRGLSTSAATVRLARHMRSLLGGETPDGKVRRANYTEIAKSWLEDM